MAPGVIGANLENGTPNNRNRYRGQMKTFTRTIRTVSVALLLVGFLINCTEEPKGEQRLGQIQWPDDGTFETVADLETFVETNPLWKALESRFRDLIADLAKDPAGAGKYFDLHQWLPNSVARWATIKRYRPHLVTPDTTALDISTGFGYFPLAGKHLFGVKSIDATDAPGVRWSDLYDDVTHVFGIRKYELFVRKFEALDIRNDGRRYDLLTSYQMVFDVWNGIWGEQEWRFFLKDVRESLLNEGGAIVLGFNQRGDVGFMKWAKPLGAAYLGEKHRAVVIVPWEALERINERQE